MIVKDLIIHEYFILVVDSERQIDKTPSLLHFECGQRDHSIILLGSMT